MEKIPSNLSYENLWKSIIRPPRDIYSENDLGSKRYKRNNNKYYTRTDYSIMSTRGFLIKCSFYEEELSTREKFQMPVVVYLHGNSSSRIEGKKMSNYLFDYNINSFILGNNFQGYFSLNIKSFAIVSSRLYKLQTLHSSILIPIPFI